MAWTVTTDKTTWGNKHVHIHKITTDSAEAEIDTGLNYVDGFALGVKSMATMTFTIVENEDSSGTADNGTIGISGVTDGDEFFLTVYGR